MRSIPSLICIQLINFYQVFLSFDHGLLRIFAPSGACKYPVSCSEYTKQAIIKHGVLKGMVMGGRRIISCR